MTLNMDGSVSGLEHELQVSHSLSLPSPSLPRSTAPREILGTQEEQQALQVTGLHRCPLSLPQHCLQGRTSPPQYSVQALMTSLFLVLPCTCVQQANPDPLSSHTLDFSPPCLAHAGSSSQKAPPAPSPLLFTFSSSLLSKPYLPTWFSVTPSPPLCSLPIHHVSKPCLPTKP